MGKILAVCLAPAYLLLSGRTEVWLLFLPHPLVGAHSVNVGDLIYFSPFHLLCRYLSTYSSARWEETMKVSHARICTRATQGKGSSMCKARCAWLILKPTSSSAAFGQQCEWEDFLLFNVNIRPCALGQSKRVLSSLCDWGILDVMRQVGFRKWFFGACRINVRSWERIRNGSVPSAGWLNLSSPSGVATHWQFLVNSCVSCYSY